MPISDTAARRELSRGFDVANRQRPEEIAATLDQRGPIGHCTYGTRRFVVGEAGAGIVRSKSALFWSLSRVSLARGVYESN